MAWGNSCGDFSRMVDLNYTNLLRFVFSLQYNDKLEYYTLCTYIQQQVKKHKMVEKRLGIINLGNLSHNS